jgi:ribosomal protein L13
VSEHVLPASTLVIFTGDIWTTAEQGIVIKATNRLAGRMASAVQSHRRFTSRVSGTATTDYTVVSAEDVFLGIF